MGDGHFWGHVAQIEVGPRGGVEGQQQPAGLDVWDQRNPVKQSVVVFRLLLQKPDGVLVLTQRHAKDFHALLGNWELQISPPHDRVGGKKSSRVTKVPLAESRRLFVTESKSESYIEKKDRKRKVKSRVR